MEKREATIDDWKECATKWKRIADQEATRCYAELGPVIRSLRQEIRRLHKALKRAHNIESRRQDHD